MSDDGQALYLGQVDVIERQDSQYVCQRALLVRQREHYAALVYLGDGAQHVGLVRVRYHQESGEVVLVVLDVILQHLQSVQSSGLGVADGGASALHSLGYHLCRSGRVFRLHILKLWVLSQEVATLHQRHWVRVHLGDGVPVVLRQATDAVSDVQLVLAHHRSAAVAQQLVVVQQRARDGILDGQHADGGGVLTHLVEHLFEGSAAYQLYLFALEVKVCRDIVERPYQSLYCYSLHYSISIFILLFFYFSILKKQVPLSLCCEAGPCFFIPSVIS